MIHTADNFPRGASICHCSACGRTFQHIGAFDEHLSGPLGARVHIDPPGSVLDSRGVWGPGEAVLEARRAKVALASSARHRTVGTAENGE